MGPGGGRTGDMALVRTGIAAVLAAIVLVGCDGGPAPVGSGAAEVVKIVDGDTIDVAIAGRTERIRLIGIDTPEIAHEAFGDRPANDAECFGDEASAFTASLIPVGTPVRLERDVVGRDDYGRLLAYVYRTEDDLFVNHEIVRRGYAQPLTIAPNVAHRDLIVDSARDAEADEAGLWAACR